ncbi:MAG: hypothetical protein KJ804_20475 [Proteobacteria bacterium]|nr:hypothetical protein [Pseudomonadota bacterium]MBU1060685.1 hypothetical protein [Pseudomonadota bacterium]
MKKKVLIFLSLCLLVACSSSAFAAVTLKHLGAHPFSKLAITSEADIRILVEKHSADLEDGFTKAGNPELFPEFKAQFPAAQIDAIQVAPGERFDWMLFRKKSSGQVKAIKDVTWGGEESFAAFRFYIDKNEQRYEFIVPAACGNLSLRNVIIPPPLNQDPVCNMTLSSSEITCGQVIVVDATGSTDPDGTISEVVFKLLDASNQVVVEESVTEAPFIQKLTVPCQSSQYTVKTVVIDNKGAQSSPADCTQTITVAQHKGGPVADIGFAHQFDPASYIFARVGYEIPLTEKLYAMGLAGGFARVGGYDGGSAFTVDALLHYYLTEKMSVAAGAGFWVGQDENIDLIVNVGYLIYEQPEKMKTSLFIEGRCEADDLISSKATRLGLGLRFQF